jgi:hypothetical protein
MTARGERGGWQDVWHRMAPRCDRESTSRLGGARPARRPRGHTVGVARTDPTDTGGLFIGRRPGTGPVHYRGDPQRGSPARRRADRALAAGVLVVETLLCLTLWGPQPLAWLWVGSQVDYHTGMVTLGIATAFAGMIVSLMLTLALAARLDHVWLLLRRAAGYDQRTGMLARIFMVSAIVAALAFGVWFLLIEGPGPTFSAR